MTAEWSVEAWQRFCDRLRDAGRILSDPRAPTDEQTQAYGLNYLMNLLNSAIELDFMTADPQRPEMGRPQDATKKWGLDCPDALYARSTIDGEGSYVITGSGGRPHYLGVSLTAGGLGTAGMRTVANASCPGALTIDADDSFTLLVGPRRAAFAGYAADTPWLATEPGELHLSVRQFFYDWEHETPLQLSIERVDRVAPGQQFTREVVVDRLEALGRFVDSSTRLWPDFVAGLRQRTPNGFAPPNLQSSTMGGTPDNVYGSGSFDLGPDEAAIVEFTPPPCHYWNLQLGSYWFESLDYIYRTGSINGFQARLTPSGRFVGVIAHRDPGVANWLDTAGNRVLPATYRFQLPACPREDVPTPQARVVAFAALASELPADVPRCTPAERADQIARRRRGALRRFGR